MPLGEEIPLERGHQRGTPLRNRNLTTTFFLAVHTRPAKGYNEACSVQEKTTKRE